MKPKLLTTLPTYTRHLFLADLVAGVTVAMVALPLSLAIAIASGAPPASPATAFAGAPVTPTVSVKSAASLRRAALRIR